MKKCSYCKINESDLSCLECEEKKRMERDNLCFNCAFWSLYVDKKDDERIARIDGNHYYIENNSSNGFVGFGGRDFKIKFNDGREIITNNLWHQGTIPDIWKDKLPDNAIFIKDKIVISDMKIIDNIK